MVKEHGIKLRDADDLNVPLPLPPAGPFEFTVAGKNGEMTFACQHDGGGVVRVQTDRTGAAEWEVDLRGDWEHEDR